MGLVPHLPDNFKDSSTKENMSSEIRNQRMRLAKLLGTHKKEQWEALKAEFGNRCVRCGTDEYNVERDHITPIYQGGSDSIENIQPLCARCNCSKGPETFNWANYRRLNGFGG